MEKSSRAPIPKSVLWLVLLSFALQVATIGIFRQYHTRPQEDHFGFGWGMGRIPPSPPPQKDPSGLGWEWGRIPRSIAQGHGFSSPYGDSTGPPAGEPPLYPYLM